MKAVKRLSNEELRKNALENVSSSTYHGVRLTKELDQCWDNYDSKLFLTAKDLVNELDVVNNEGTGAVVFRFGKYVALVTDNNEFYAVNFLGE